VLTDISRLLQDMRHAADGSTLDVDPAKIIDEIISAPKQVKAERHPIGFLHIELTPLVPVEKFERLRFHVWPASMRQEDEAGSVHDHIWDLTSVVIHGELRDRNYAPDPSPFGRFHGSRVAYGERNEFEDAGRYNLELVNDRRVASGGVYKIPPRIVHTTEIIGSPTMTMVLANERPDGTGTGPLLLNRSTVPIGTAFRSQISESALNSELRVLRSLLD
jgi:hypothetical protein